MGVELKNHKFEPPRKMSPSDLDCFYLILGHAKCKADFARCGVDLDDLDLHLCPTSFDRFAELSEIASFFALVLAEFGMLEDVKNGGTIPFQLIKDLTKAWLCTDPVIPNDSGLTIEQVQKTYRRHLYDLAVRSNSLQ